MEIKSLELNVNAGGRKSPKINNGIKEKCVIDRSLWLSVRTFPDVFSYVACNFAGGKLKDEGISLVF